MRANSRRSFFERNRLLFVAYILIWLLVVYVFVSTREGYEYTVPPVVRLNKDQVPEIDEVFNADFIKKDDKGKTDEKSVEKAKPDFLSETKAKESPEAKKEDKEEPKKVVSEVKKPEQNDIPPEIDAPQLSDTKQCISYMLDNDWPDIDRRDYDKKPITIKWKPLGFRDDCDIPCIFVTDDPPEMEPDGVMSAIIFGGKNALNEWNKKKTQKKIILGMESASNYRTLDVATARSMGYDITMTTDLNSDVPSPYFSWAEYAFLSEPSNKTELSMAAAFISNCGTGNVAKKRIEVVKHLQSYGVTVDSYGRCNHNKDDPRSVPKTDMLRKYKFSLAFENTDEPDYVTEKFFQTLDAGSVPVSIAPQNIDDFAPNNHSIVNINSFKTVKEAAEFIIAAANDEKLYDGLVDWKRNKPDDRFYALVDLSSVHSQCRLCIKLADYSDMYTEEEHSDKITSRPCKCTVEGNGTVVYHLYVRERNTYHYKDIFISKLSLSELYFEIYKEFADHTPRWAGEQTRGVYESGNFRIFSVYQWRIDLTPRKALFGDISIDSDEKLTSLLEETRCPKLEVIFI